MKRSVSLFVCLALALLVVALNGTAQPPVSAAPRLQATATPGVVIEPVNPTPQPTIPTAGSGSSGGTINGTPIPGKPSIKPPKSLDELRRDYPDLGPFIDKYKDATVADIPMAELYARVVEIFNKDGATGVAVFLEDSGLLDKLNIPLSYLDLLRAFDEGGLAEVEKLATARKIINSNNEIVGYLALDTLENEAKERERLTALGVSVYRLIEETEELEIGIPLEILSQLQTPGKLLEYLAMIADSEHIQGFRVPTPTLTSGLKLQGVAGIGAKTIGADKWHAAGITGKGIKVGILDMGFGGFADLLGSELPENVETNISARAMNAQQENHGTACAAVVHSVAPDAELFLAYFDGNSRDSFIEALTWLQEQGVQVINYSVGSAIGPRDGTFGDAPLVDAFVRETGILWVVAAGNYALSHTILKYKAGEDGLHNFGDNDDVYTMPFIAGEPVTSVVMNWNGNWKGGEKSQYDFFILDENGNELAAGNEPRRGKRNDFPFQIQVFEANPGSIYYLAIRRTRGTTDNLLDIFIPNGVIVPWAQVPQLSVTTPGDADSALTVGATGLSKDVLEDYSSQGPTFDERIKPDISAPTGEVVAGYDSGFIGTSGAAPMVAGAAALIWQAFPDMTQAEVKAFLVENIVDLGEQGADPQFGTGRLQLPNPSGETGDTTGDNTSNEQVALISDVNVKVNVKVGRDTGVQIKTSFELDNFSGKQLLVAGLFFDADGNAVPSSNAKFDVNGTIGTAVAVTPKRNQTAFKNVTLFVPNSAFQEVTVSELSLIVGVLDVTDKNNAVVVAKSDPIVIRVSRR
jgi:hypothetical protein